MKIEREREKEKMSIFNNNKREIVMAEIMSCIKLSV